MANGLLGDPTALRGLLQSPSTTDFALAMLANSGYSPRRRSLGEIVGASMLQSRQMAAEQAQQKLREEYMRAQIANMQQRQEPRPEELEIIAGDDGKPIYVPRSQAAGKSPFLQARGETSQTAALQEYEQAKSQGYAGTFMDYKRDMAEMARGPAQGPNYAPQFSFQRIERPDGTIGVYRANERTGQIEDTGQNAPKPQIDPKDATNLRKDFNNQPSVKSYAETLPLLVSARNAPDTGFGDLQLIYTAGKILDPGSVVREGELQLALAAGSPIQRFLGFSRFNASEGGRLTPEVRKQLLEMLNERVLAYRQGYERDRVAYSQYAKELGVNPTSVVGTHVASAYSPSRARPPALSRDQYPEGTVIRNKEGKELIRRNGQWVPR